MTQIIFRAAGTPVAQGNHRASRSGRIYETTKGHAAWRRAVFLAARSVADVRGQIEGPIGLSLVFIFARPPSHITKSGKLRKGKPLQKVTRPDLSKCIRAVEDAITDAELWQDDSYVVWLRASKLYGTHPGVKITITEIGTE